MLSITTQTPQQSLSSEIIRFRPEEKDFNRFKETLNQLLGKIDEADREKNQENHIRDFLLNSFYKNHYEVNGKGDIDLVIHEGKTAQEKVGVILETKRPQSKEMISVSNPNNKALHQAILYFFRERAGENNINLKYIVVTNIKEWFIFRAGDFNRLFYENATFRRQYENWENNALINRKTSTFYDDIAKPFVEELDETIVCTHFKLQDYETATEKDLIALYKLFSPFYLLKKPFENDSNRLDPNFYSELLHIIGLEETRERNKTLIKRKAKPDSGSLLEKAIAKIESKYSRFDQKKMLEFGATREERIYNIALELCIVWTNRVLFLKLLESQLVAYHDDKDGYSFLNTRKINSFGELYVLFHDVLNKTIAARDENVRAKYAHVPYLNSSLFDFADVENLTVTIDELDNNINLGLPNSSILKKLGESATDLPTLEYLFRFLDAYDFASEGKEDVQQENRSLINASVLGKVFEKINGYKDGSIYTPGFITMYMCRQAIRLAVVQKFKDETDFDSDSFDDLQNYVGRFYKADDIRRFNALINDLKLCDPAVGSGHFLVSALNEILAIKSELGILADASGKPFNQYTVKVANDEIIVTDRDNKPFAYKVRGGRPSTDEMQNLQTALFHEKQQLIENCLFGVDINPNSVKICRLRLWIELLKNAYYKPETHYAELETLPNIDINIKQGNSLLSRFALDADLKQALKTKDGIKDYRDKVYQYKNERNRDTKRELIEIIDKIKGDFRTEIFKSHPKMRELARKERRLFEINSPQLFDKYSDGEREVLSRNLEREIALLKAEIKAIQENAIYKNAFEWRFEFPEVLDDDGNFLGFDIVIGNPPYFGIATIEKNLQDALGKSNYQTFSRASDIYCLFYEKGFEILKPNSPISFITSNRFCFTNYGIDLRKYLSEKNILGLINFNDVDVFESANVGSLIGLLTKSKPANVQITSLDYKNSFSAAPLTTVIEENAKLLNQKFFTNSHWNFDNDNIQTIKFKIERHGIHFTKWKDISINRGITTGLNEIFIISEDKRNRIIDADPKSAEIIKPVLKGANIKRFSILPPKEYLIYTYTGIEVEEYKGVFNYLGRHRKELENVWEARHGQKKWYELRKCSYYNKFFEPKLVWTRLSNHNAFAISENSEFTVDSSSFAVSKDIKYLSAILNSKVVFFYFKLGSVIWGKDGIKWFGNYFDNIPVPEISPEAQSPFIKLVDEILELKKQGADTTEQENKIDEMVFDLYELDEAERKIVSGAA